LRFDDGFVLADIEEGATGERRFGQGAFVIWDGREGFGTLQVLAVGDHLPTGLRGFTDGAP
jgi:hypothetical protein